MFFIISKSLSFLSSPIIWIFVLLILAMISKKEKMHNRYLTFAVLLFYLFSNEFLFDISFGRWEFRYDKKALLANNKVYESGIVLGGMTWYDEHTRQPQFLRAGDRLNQAIWLLKQGKIKKLIISGGAGSLSTPHIKEADHLKSWLKQIGFNDSLIVIDNVSNNTHENAIISKRILDSLRITDKPNLLITSASHIRRSMACFVKEGVVFVEPYPVDYYSSEFRIEFDHCLIPNTDTFHAYTVVMHEMIGYIVYKIMGYC